MKYTLCYFDGGEYHYQDLTHTNEWEAVEEAKRIMQTEHKDVFERNEWEVQA